jgi:hypothetical protein
MIKKNKFFQLFTIFALTGSMFMLAGCPDNNNGMEEAAEEVGDEIGDGMDEVGDEIDDATN